MRRRDANQQAAERIASQVGCPWGCSWTATAEKVRCAEHEGVLVTTMAAPADASYVVERHNEVDE